MLDLASGFSSSSAAVAISSDPWGDNYMNKPKQQLNNDPWGTPIPPPSSSQIPVNKQPVNNQNILNELNDPWSIQAPPVPVPVNNNINKNPWGSVNTNDTKLVNDPWGGSGSNGVVSNGNNIDEFEIFTNNRVVSPSNVPIIPPTPSQQPASDLFGDFFGTTASKTSTNPWNDTNASSSGTNAMSTSSNKTTLNPIRKTPESFLGENSALVNLDNLIPTNSNNNMNSNQFILNNNNNRPKSTNPFGGAPATITGTTSMLQQSTSAGALNKAPTVNPFMQQAAQQKGPSMNQLSNNNSIFPSFNQATPSPTSQLAQPLIIPPSSAAIPGIGGNVGLYPTLSAIQTPYGVGGIPANGIFNQSQQQSTNPFL